MLSIVVPAYREGSRLEQSLDLLVGAVSRLGEPFELIVVVDGGDPATAEAARAHARVALVIALPHQRGKGYALRRGIREATGDVIVYIDADMELHPDGIGPLVARLRNGGEGGAERADAAIGSKRHPDSQVAYPLARKMQSVAFQMLVQAMFGLHLTDTQAGLKAFRADAVREVERDLWVDGFAFDVELLVALQDHGARIVEGPVQVVFAFESTTRLNSTARVLRDVISLWWYRRGKRRGSGRAGGRTRSAI